MAPMTARQLALALLSLPDPDGTTVQFKVYDDEYGDYYEDIKSILEIRARKWTGSNGEVVRKDVAVVLH